MRRSQFREMMDKIGEEHRLHRAELAAMHEDQKRRFDAIDVAMEHDKRLTREMVLDLREQTAMLRDLRHGIQANTEGLLRVLDEFRRNDGPSAAGA